MSFFKTGASAIGKLFIVIALAGTFLVGMVGTVYLALRGEELKVPEIVGKNFAESEKELTAMGLKIKRRADRFSEEKPNTVLEQLPKAGDTVKSGQMILVVVSKTNPEGTEAPATVKKDSGLTDDGDANVNPDKPKKNTNSNVKRPAQTTRDVVSNKPTKNGNVNSSSSDSANSTTKSNSNTGTTTNPANKSGANTSITKPTPNPVSTPKPSASKTPTSGDIRTRKVPN